METLKYAQHSGDTKNQVRKFFRKAARGKVIKALRERYLRTDVSCGVQYCSLCSQLDHSSEGPFKSPSEELPQFGDKFHISFPNGHFVLPDAICEIGAVLSLIAPESNYESIIIVTWGRVDYVDLLADAFIAVCCGFLRLTPRYGCASRFRGTTDGMGAVHIGYPSADRRQDQHWPPSSMPTPLRPHVHPSLRLWSDDTADERRSY
ncbi:hypothetical protein AB1N83_009853 [Pleurotus pulmonarius]